MSSLGKLADQARDCLLHGKAELLATYMDQNFQWRRKMYGDEVVGANNIRAVEIAHAHGLAAKFTGSGGALVCMRRDSATWFDSASVTFTIFTYH